MINFNTEKIDNNVKIDKPLHKEQKQTPSSQVASVPTSYENSGANLAITSFGKSLVKKSFKPAKTQEELINQIKNIEWLTEDNRTTYFVDTLNSEEDIIAISEILHKLDNLSPILQKKIKPDFIISAYRNSTTYAEKQLAKKFSIENLNKIDPKLQEIFDINFNNYIFKAANYDIELLNKLFNSINEEYREDVFSSYRFDNSKEELNSQLLKSKSLNELDKDIMSKISAQTVVFSKLPTDYLEKQAKFLNSLSAEEKNTLSSSYLSKIFETSYSYALENHNHKPVCGTKEFKPFERKEELKKELASMKNSNGEWQFYNEQIDQIINNENDIGELSKILHAIKTSNIQIEPYIIKDILLKEGITLNNSEHLFEFLQLVQNSPEFKEIKDAILENDNIWYLTKEEVENIKKNLALVEELKKINPEEFEKQKNNRAVSILRILKGNKVNIDIIKQIFAEDIFPEKVDFYVLESSLQDEKLNNVKPQNIKFLKDLKNSEETQFLYKKNNSRGLSNYNVFDVLNLEIPEDFDLQNQKEMLKLVEYINHNVSSNMLAAKLYIDILQKNDNFEDGKYLVNYLIENNKLNNLAHELLTTNTFKENKEVLERIENISILNDADAYGNKRHSNYTSFAKYPLKHTKDALEVIEFANNFDCFKDCYIELYDVINCYSNLDRYGLESCNKEEIKQNIQKLAGISKTIDPNIWKEVKKQAITNALKNDKTNLPNYKPENIEYFNKFVNDERTKELFNIYDLDNLLKDDLDIDALYKNYEAKFKFVEKYKNEIYNSEFITYTGDIEKLEHIYEEFKKNYPHSQIQMSINEKSNIVSFKVDNEIHKYDKNLNLVSKIIGEQKQQKNGQIQTILTVDDDSRRMQHTITYRKDFLYDDVNVPTHIVSKYYGEDKSIEKIRIYDESSLDGVYNIKEMYPDGKIKTISSGYSNVNGEFIEKHLESLDGTKSDIFYKKDKLGNEDYTYTIVDKSGKEILNLRRTTEIIDENSKITTVNNKKYKIEYSDNDIKVFDYTKNQEVVLDLNELNPKRDETLKDMLKTLSGDELLKVKEYVKELELTKIIKSGMDPIAKKMYIGPHKFIFEHELGHAKDEILATIEELSKLENIDEVERKIAKDSKLQEIFNEEKALFKEKMSDIITQEADYFINDTIHYGGKLGGLRETIAETNAIQCTPKFHPLLMMRTELIQEYFPRTVAYLINNSL